MNTKPRSTLYQKNNKNSHKKKNIYLIISLIAVIVIVGLVLVSFNHHHSTTKIASASNNAPSSPAKLSAVESGLLPWHLTSPLSRMAVFTGSSANQIKIIGGLTAQGTSATGIYNLNTTNGNLALVGNLPQAIHDAGYANVNGNMEIFGGGSTNSVKSNQIVAPSGSVVGNSSLPGLRSDSTAVTVGKTTYVIGGYNGNNADNTVLSTTNGKNFSNYGTLPMPVRYAAVSAINGNIYIFGGLAVNGPNSGKPVTNIQEIDMATHKISNLSWKLPIALEGASAMTIGNQMYLAGGQTDVTLNHTLGMGTTQLNGITVASSKTNSTIWAVDTLNHQLLKAGQLQVPVSNAGLTIVGNTAWLVGGESNNNVTSAVQIIRPNSQFGIAGQPGAGSPYYGDKLMIADRGNNRILVMNSSMQITWKFPSATTPANNVHFYFPDDAFFANHGTEIISNQENNNTIVKIAYPSGKINWTFGHPMQPGSANGYLRAPDDAYQLKNGQVVVADDQNCRVLFINPNGTVASQIGTTGYCKHNPPIGIASPNGDTPLYDGNILISEILGSWVSEYTPQGHLVWTTHLPISYPSDPQQIGASPGHNPNLYLIADYSNPGAILTFNRQGQILSRYQPTSGPGRLNSPSLVEKLPSGVYMANDDHRDRMVAIDPATGALVWQYGVNDTPGTSAGMLNKVDGFDLLAPNGTTPTHGMTG